MDKYHELFKDAFHKIGISFDIYHRTSAKLHHETSQDFFRTLYEKGEFVEKESEQYFDEEANQFLADRYIVGTCPKCGHGEAYGDQCENCGSSLSPIELKEPRSTLSGSKPVLKKTKHWYLQLDKYEDWLREWINTGILDGKQLHDPKDWKNHVLGQCKSWLDGGLQPRSMTRDLDWGVDVPSEIEGAEGKKLYVWMDAPIGYVSATKEWAAQNNKDWELYWKDKDTALIHFIGKDNIVFHCLIFPAILRAHGGFVLPVNVPANQFMNLEGRKISTSKNWAVWVNEYLEDFTGKEDELRYTMIKNMPEQKDSEFTWQAYQEANNNELVNNLANFVNRVVVLTNKYYEGVVPEFDEDQEIISPEDQMNPSFHEAEMLDLFDDLDKISSHIRKFDFRSALSDMMQIASKGNQLLQFNEPWKNIKEDEEWVKSVMNLGVQIVGALSYIIKPFLPFTSERMRNLLNLPELGENGELLEMMNNLCEGELIVPSGHKINKPTHLFNKIEDDVIEAQRNKLLATDSEDMDNPIKETISYEDFAKLDMRTATIISAEAVPKADKLLKIGVDLGFEKRTVVSGIAKHFNPDDIIGKKVILLANLAPRKIRGVESNGMILMADGDDDSISFLRADDDWSDGATIS